MNVNVIDAPMGCGKTSAMINYMNAHPEQRYMFVTPFLSETERVMAQCTGLDFKTPEVLKSRESGVGLSKLVDLKRLLTQRENIVTTHALFATFDEDVSELIFQAEYVLVMDEVANVIELCDLHPKDAVTVQNEHVTVADDGMLVWNEDNGGDLYNGRFADIKALAQSGCLWRYNSTNIVSLLPIRLFSSFKEVFLMTYMFKDSVQRCYFDMYGIEYHEVFVTGNSPQTYSLTTEPREYGIPGLANKVHICRDEKLNHVGAKVAARYPLSHGWYERAQNAMLVTLIGRHIRNYFRRYSAPVHEVMWTAFKERTMVKGQLQTRKPMVNPHGYAKGFVPCTSRATNEFRYRKYLAYPLNRFMSPPLKNFLIQRGVTIDEDRWALSEMLQWIWRSAIRDGKEIWIYIPSERMRGLLEDWIKEVDTAA